MKDARLQTKLQEMIEGMGAALQEVHPEMGEKFTDATILECCIPALAAFLIEENTDPIIDHIAGSFSAVLTMPEVYEIMRPMFYGIIFKHMMTEEMRTEEYAQFLALATVVMAMNGLNDKSAYTIASISVIADSRQK